MMVSFSKIETMQKEETIICKYIINKINTIAYNLKELGKRECKHESL